MTIDVKYDKHFPPSSTREDRSLWTCLVVLRQVQVPGGASTLGPGLDRAIAHRPQRTRKIFLDSILISVIAFARYRQGLHAVNTVYSNFAEVLTCFDGCTGLVYIRK